MLASITLQELKQQTSLNYQIIDIRPPHEYLHGHAPNAVNIPYDALLMYPETYLKKDQNYYLICAYGSQSQRASDILRSYGYNVANVKNGYEMRCYYW